MSIPNCLTLLRIFLVPVFVIAFYIPQTWAIWLTVIIFIFAAITDWLDGYLARSLAQTSKLGAFLDPVADKLIVACALVLLVGEVKLAFFALPAAVIVGREIVISALREWMAELGKRTSVAVSYIGKVKTVFQMMALIILLMARPGSLLNLPGLFEIGLILLTLAAVLTLYTMVIYLRSAWPDLVKNS